ncbi:hypothetical protein LEP1GSC172_3317 [Leptospira noguchii]|uniref:Uncharacterized protein n=1 Tax=Leptospira noguchii TaxID=28182 RepID=M6VFW9_9LEPT|nr:hypothetical protein LEP1GSC172_3317 [Leptospira noguchii]
MGKSSKAKKSRCLNDLGTTERIWRAYSLYCFKRPKNI